MIRQARGPSPQSSFWTTGLQCLFIACLAVQPGLPAPPLSSRYALLKGQGKARKSSGKLEENLCMCERWPAQASSRTRIPRHNYKLTMTLRLAKGELVTLASFPVRAVVGKARTPSAEAPVLPAARARPPKQPQVPILPGCPRLTTRSSPAHASSFPVRGRSRCDREQP